MQIPMNLTQLYACTCTRLAAQSDSVILLSTCLRNYRLSPSFLAMKRQNFHIQKRCLYTRKYISRMFINPGKPQPKETDLVCKSHKLMLYNDIIAQGHTGAFHMLPFGLRAFEKLSRLIDEELQALGCEKLMLTTMTSKHLWQKTGRWDSMGSELFKLKDRHDMYYCLGPTHEEAVTDLVGSQPISYRTLPIMLYQTTRKFRDEMAPKYGLLRGREFEMKDLYTFDSSEENAKETYERINNAYISIFNRLHLNYIRVAGDSGAIGGDLSHEFHILADIGQDKLLICSDCGLGWNQELVDSQSSQTCSRSDCGPNLTDKIGIEVGHTFFLGTKYSKPLNATFQTETGKQELLQMGCYGLGVTRILQSGLEVLSLENQIRWPHLLAPYQVLIIPQKAGYKAGVCLDLAECLSDRLSLNAALTNEVVIDDRTQMTIGKRLYEAKRLGFPYIVVAGKTALQTPAMFEVIEVASGATETMTEDQLFDKLSCIETIPCHS
ncbi:probable proline--tRNA ligase, mitochondrial [Liolophura sinensis]|uniref:probable proline--tRNA ligase, mitochondrial n=1 Tax=Liolophura sinensis TaxID=3198878 RepID=UPI0031595B99